NGCRMVDGPKTDRECAAIVGGLLAVQVGKQK
ncbi:MAG: hypothetical protein RL700_2069, partial [Pseudomonadota bacterium]